MINLFKLSNEYSICISNTVRMSLVHQYQVYNRRQQGLAETSHLILEFANASYEDVFVEVLLLSNCIALPNLIIA
jgi:hypothetical protein